MFPVWGYSLLTEEEGPEAWHVPDLEPLRVKEAIDSAGPKPPTDVADFDRDVRMCKVDSSTWLMSRRAIMRSLAVFELEVAEDEGKNH